MTHDVVEGPDAPVPLTVHLPIDRSRCTLLIETALGWSADEESVDGDSVDGDSVDGESAEAESVDAEECGRVARELTYQARALTDELRCRAPHVDPDDPALGALTRTLLAEADRRLSVPHPDRADLLHTQNRARLVQALYRGLDRLDAARRTHPH
ncbi:hypothetical protein ACIQNU_16765 [Streptomyces sp. NPDC091292]|uniref:hypothetical protein n=1 Tax=Streptomyces sp. NPDC091292 TaxID=3365991 RepID=UPI00381E7E78